MRAFVPEWNQAEQGSGFLNREYGLVPNRGKVGSDSLP
jgi:hypothetical protein